VQNAGGAVYVSMAGRRDTTRRCLENEYNTTWQAEDGGSKRATAAEHAASRRMVTRNAEGSGTYTAVFTYSF
jgi:hypothetical protein